MTLSVIPLERMFVLGAALLLLGVLASKMSTKLGIPALVLFLAGGMLAGSEGIGGIPFDDFDLARVIGTATLAFILFAGGLDSSWTTIRSVLWKGVSLSTLGVLLTTLVVALSTRLLLGLAWIEALLLGAIVASTDAAAVFGLLRARGLQLRGRLTPLLELESGSNDPMAIFLTFALTALALDPTSPWLPLLGTFAVQMTLGAAVGIAFGIGWSYLINRIRLEYDGLYPVLTLALVMGVFGVASVIGGNAFLATYAAGVALGSRKFVHRLALIQFHDGIAWLMQITMFITLGLLVFPSQLLPIVWSGLAVSLVLVFIARPVAVFLSLLFARMSVREKAFVSWVGLRGAVPIVLATIPVTAGVPGSTAFFNIVFFVVVVSVVLQGMSIPWVARALGVAGPDVEEMGETKVPQATIELSLGPDSPVVGRMVVDLQLPPSAMLLLLRRGGESYIPRGSTVLKSGDGLLVATRKHDADDLRRQIEG